jgi:PEP-CTERM motif
VVLSSGITETKILNSNVGGSGSVNLSFGSANSYYGANSTLFLYQNTHTGQDDIEVEVVPEPGTWAMMLGGLAMLVVWQRRKNRS